MIEFKEFSKIPRLSRDITITEKIDGTNASIYIAEDYEILHLGSGRSVPFLCGSRSRWIFPENDNHGFARWAYENVDLVMCLGPGRHFGEWWGAGIQRKYGKKDKTFSLFNVTKWNGTWVCEPGPIQMVPVLYEGPFSMEAVDGAIDLLKREGSRAAPGYGDPEGIVVWHSASGHLYKKTIKDDEKPKGMVGNETK